VAGFDLNSDRVNLVIIDGHGRIVDTRTAWFTEAVSHGFSRNRARALRLGALAKLLKYCYTHNVGVVVFENLPLIKRRRFTRSRVGNRKITLFAKRQLIQYGIVMALKYGFKTLLTNPKGNNKLQGTQRSNEKTRTRQTHSISIPNSPKRPRDIK
jgi:transposase, IS605 OrfB family, central region